MCLDIIRKYHLEVYILMEDKLKTMFLSLQKCLEANLSASRNSIEHPGSKGDASENSWLSMLQEHLPNRYQVDKAFVIDSDGNISDQIDIVIYDRQYTPLLYNKHTQIHVPAESVYAIFEVKQELNKDYIEYAGKKISSVRRLKRTSTSFVDGGKSKSPRDLFRILGGILTLSSRWTPAFGDSLKDALKTLSVEEQIDLGCVIQNGAFEVTYNQDGTINFQQSNPELTFIYFLIRLLDRLQKLGTVSAIDYSEYSKALGL